MADTTQGVEATVTNAPSNLVEDYEAVLAAKDAEIAKVTTEKENYRKGLLKAKGKLPDDSSDEAVGQIELMRQIAREELLNTQEIKLAAEKEELTKKMARELREAKLALQNKSQVSSGGVGGSTEEKMTVKDNFFTDSQISDLKARGYDDKKIERLKKNLLNSR